MRVAGAVRFHDLGALEVERDGAPVPLGGGRLAAALSLLLIEAGRSVGVDALTDALCGRGRSPSTLDSHVWRLRKALEPDRAPEGAHLDLAAPARESRPPVPAAASRRR